MIRRGKNSSLGFTLIELAIVLAIAGIMFGGLWRLLAGGNQQLKDTATATQQLQLISAVKSFLASPDGQTFMGGKCTTGGGCASGLTFAVPLPTATCPTSSGLGAMSASQQTTWCNSLPAGFTSATVNSYGQTYGIQAMFNSATTAASTAPSTYSFMIVTSGGDVIPDTDGGRISSQTGSDGGFIYSSNICGSSPSIPSWSCGAYGNWSSLITTYNFTAPGTGGYVASRTYISPEQDSNLPWLARIHMPGDSLTSPTYNKMTTMFLLGDQLMYMGTDNTAADTTGAASIMYMQGGQIIGSGTNTPGGSINPSGISIVNSDPSGNGGTNVNPQISIGSSCNQNPALGFGPGSKTTAGNTCVYSLQVAGDANIIGLINTTYVYESSDRRLKKDIYPLTNSLDNIMKLKPVGFTFKTSGVQSLGVIAQDLEKVYPQLVSYGDEKTMKSVNYDGLIAPLINAVQELKQENDKLREELHAQELREDKLEQEIQAKRP